MHLREWIRDIVGLERYVVHTEQKKREMLSAGARAGRCVTGTGLAGDQSAALP